MTQQFHDPRPVQPRPERHGWIQSLFGDIDPVIAAELTSKLVSFTLRRGETLFEAGADANNLYVIERGKIKLSRSLSHDDPRRESLLNVLGDGQVFGELSLLDPGPRTTTAVAITQCELRRLSGTALDQALTEHPELARGLLRQLAHRLRTATDYASDLVLNDVHGRTARTILRLADLFGVETADGIVVKHGLTQQEIAHMVGASRESVNKFLMELTESGYMQLSYRAFVILDRSKLEERAERLNPQPLPRD